MKIHSSSAAAAAATPARDSERAGPSRRTEPVATATAPEATTVELSSSPGRGPQSGPPGLERVLARLKAMDEGTLSPGQARAMERIERNLARYLENQGLAAAPAPAPEAPPVVEPEAPVPVEGGELPVTDAPAPEPVVDAAPEPVVTVPVVDSDAALVETLLGDPAPTAV